MSKPLLALCGKPKIAMRDGWTGATAHVYLPFYDKGDSYWFASGQEYTFPSGLVAQDKSVALVGTSKPNTFIKAPGVCISGS